MAQMTKVYFYICIIFLSVMSSYWLSGFPFDNLCLCDDNPDDNPEGSGCDTTKEVRKRSTTKLIPIFLITNNINQCTF